MKTESASEIPAIVQEVIELRSCPHAMADIQLTRRWYQNGIALNHGNDEIIQKLTLGMRALTYAQRLIDPVNCRNN